MKTCGICKESKPLDEFISDKRVKNGTGSRCKPCQRQVSKEYRRKNPEKVRDYYRNNRERLLADQRRYYEENPEKYKAKIKANCERIAKDPKWIEYKREWHRKNADRYREYHREWAEANREKTREYRRKSENKRRARLRSLPFEDVDHLKVFKRDSGICGICCEPVNPEDWHLDHIVPLALGGSHLYENVQVSHPRCNLSKGSRLAA